MNLRGKLEELFATANGENRRPILGRGNESSVKGLYVVGDLAGAPVIKLAMAQGVEVIDYIASLPEIDSRKPEDGLIDVLVVGAGAAGLNAALAAREKGLSCVVLEKGAIANTIENFPENKWVYAEPDESPAKGKLWLDGARKEDLIERWNSIVSENGLEVHTEEPLVDLERAKDGSFVAKTSGRELRARKIVLATGQRGNPRKLGVPGEGSERVYHRLYSPRKYEGKEILVVGGGNSAIEAALTLSEKNKVRLSYRNAEFTRIFKDNREQLEEAVADGKIELIMSSNVVAFEESKTRLEAEKNGSMAKLEVRADYSFVLIGAELPVPFLKRLGIRLENEWSGIAWRSALLTLASFVGMWFLGGQQIDSVPAQVAGGVLGFGSLAGLIATGLRGDRWSWLGLSFFIWYSIYGIKFEKGGEFWPYGGWGYSALSFFDRPWSFWYTVIYTALMTVFGVRALKRWGLEKRDKFQIWRYASLISFQWIFFFLVPEFLFQWAVEYQWVGESLATNPQFAEQSWRSYGLVYAWPLFFYSFFYDPHQIWIIWGVALTFVVIPIFVLFQGKRYCSWICGCGGLAETFGDQWRHLAPKGKASIQWEWMSHVILWLAVAVTGFMLLRDSIALFREPADFGVQFYRVVADVWLVGILPVTLYPFLGGKVWCRYWCPLAKMMGILSKFYAKVGLSRFAIEANEKCIGCYECSRNCQVGIPVMQYALKQERLDNETSSCIGCGICVSACPMDTLSFGKES